MPFQLDQLSRIVTPSAPVRWGDRVVYVLKRADAEKKRYKTSLYAVPITGGEPTRLTQGEHADRGPVADPAGRFLLFISDRERGSQVWRLESTGGEARRLTSFGHGSIGAMTLSADGTTLVVTFTPANAKDAAPALITHRLDHPAGDDGTEAFAGASADEPAWKDAEDVPVARVFARTHVRTDGAGWEAGFTTHLWSVHLEAGTARRITSGPHAYGLPSISSDGKTVFSPRLSLPHGDRDPTRNELVSVDVATGTARVLAAPDGSYDSVSPSSDGRFLAAPYSPGSDKWGTKNVRLAVLDLAAGTHRTLGESLDRPVGDWCLDDLSSCAFQPWRAVWNADNASVVVMMSDRACTRLIQLGLDGSTRWLTPHGVCCSFPVPTQTGIAVLHGSGNTFLEVAHVGVTGNISLLTDHNAALRAACEPRQPERVLILRDGVEVQAFYLAPRGASAPAPAIVNIHGGPSTAYADRLYFEMHWLADQGYGVLWGNPRGSHTFGEDYCGSIEGHWGDPDGKDQEALAAWLAARPEIDGERIGVQGGSYGGFMSLYLAGTSTKFKAFASDRGLYDWASAVGGSDFGHFNADLYGGDMPWNTPAAYLANSSVRFADKVTAPFLILHGEGDMRCDKSQAFLVYEALQRRGVTTALLLYPEEPHGMIRVGRLDRRCDRMRQVDAWFRRFL